jgi:glucosylceramidase
MRLTRGVDRVAANYYSQTLVLSNISRRTCAMRGYPGLQLVGREGRVLHVTVRDGGGYTFADHGRGLVTLAPGGMASFAFGGLGIDGGRHRRCPTATSVRVVPPEAQGQLGVASGASVCPEGIEVSAVGPGRDSASPGFSEPVVRVNDRVLYQRFSGVGAAMTDTSAWLIQDELAPLTRAMLLTDLYGAGGIQLNSTLVPIGASDFTRTGQPYTYDDMAPGESDPQLSHFSIAHDEDYIVPALRQILAVNPQSEIFAVPWTAPTWMKSNGAFDDLNLSGALLPSAYQPLADYVVSFIRAYAGDGVPINAIVPVNEPSAGSAFPAMSFPEPAEAQWITRDLWPALQAANLDPKIYGYDDTWGSTAYAQALLSSPARAALSGIAWHCYQGIPDSMSTIHELAPTLDVILAECSPGIIPYPVPDVVIGSMRNWASTVLLWNLALDPSGGPVQPPNTGCTGCTGVVTISEQSHMVALTPAYYQLGQVSKFVQPGAQRISSTSFVTYYDLASGPIGASAGLDDVAFLNPDRSRVLVAYNNSSASIQFTVSYSGRSLSYMLAPEAMVTLVWDRPATRPPSRP